MPIKALKQVLDALENLRQYDYENSYGLDEKITAIRKAIKRVENPDVDWNGWLKRDVYFEDGEALMHSEPEWVGLTDADIAHAMHGNVEGSNMLPYQFARAIEAKLKEKNT